LLTLSTNGNSEKSLLESQSPLIEAGLKLEAERKRVNDALKDKWD